MFDLCKKYNQKSLKIGSFRAQRAYVGGPLNIK